MKSKREQLTQIWKGISIEVKRATFDELDKSQQGFEYSLKRAKKTETIDEISRGLMKAIEIQKRKLSDQQKKIEQL